MEVTMAKKPAKSITRDAQKADAPVVITPRAESDRPAYEMLGDRYDDPFQRVGGPDAGEPD
jgi:hypothetical protein